MTSNPETTIEKAGAEARARGETFLANPYLRSAALPAATGEALATWQAKHDAWHRGYMMEDAIRG